jgi:hypothetical protein
MASNILAGANFMMAFASSFVAQEEAAAIRAQGDFQRDQFLRNAQFAELQGEDAKRRGALKASRFRSQVRGVEGAQRAAFSGNGIDVASQSVSHVAGDTFLKGELDALTIENNAFREAFGFRVEASELRASGENARLASRVKAGNTLITGGLKSFSFGAKGLSQIEKDDPVKNTFDRDDIIEGDSFFGLDPNARFGGFA